MQELSDGCWSNPEYDALVREQEPIVDPDERQEVVHEVLAMSYSESPSIALAYPNNIEAYRNDLVTDFTPVPGDDGYLIPNYNNVGMVTVRPADGELLAVPTRRQGCPCGPGGRSSSVLALASS